MAESLPRVTPLPVVELFQLGSRRNNYSNDTRTVIVHGIAAIPRDGSVDEVWVVSGLPGERGAGLIEYLDANEWTRDDPEAEWRSQ